MKITIEVAKIQARNNLLKMKEALRAYDCGITLTSYLDPKVARASEGYDEAVDWLRENDPDFPERV